MRKLEVVGLEIAENAVAVSKASESSFGKIQYDTYIAQIFSKNNQITYKEEERNDVHGQRLVAQG
jgi:hypothetical protein